MLIVSPNEITCEMRKMKYCAAILCQFMADALQDRRRNLKMAQEESHDDDLLPCLCW